MRLGGKHVSSLLLVFMACQSHGVAGRHARGTLPALPNGIWLPVTLLHSLKAGKTHVGSAVVTELTQPVPLGQGHNLDPHTRVLGTVVASSVNAAGPDHSTLRIRFHSIALAGGTRPITVSVRAVATYAEVADTAAPVTGIADRGNPSAANWTTRQIGGDEVCRSGWMGDLYNTTMQKVGSADFHGVYSLPTALTVSGVILPRAVGSFSTTARGLYGFGEAFSMSSEGDVFTLHSSERASLHGGDALLLEVVSSGTQGRLQDHLDAEQQQQHTESPAQP